MRIRIEFLIEKSVKFAIGRTSSTNYNCSIGSNLITSMAVDVSSRSMLSEWRFAELSELT